MKIKTTMLSGVAGAIALAAFLSAPAYGAGHLMPATVPTDLYGDVLLLDPDTDPITGDLAIRKDAEDSTVLPSLTDPDPITPELQNDSDLDDQLELFSPLSIEGQVDNEISGQSGVEIQDEGNVSLFSTTSATNEYNYDVARKTYVWDESEGNTIAPPGSNGLPVTDGDGTTGTLIEEIVAGYWMDDAGTPVFIEYTDDGGNIFMVDDGGTPEDESTYLTDNFKTWLEAQAGTLDNLNGDPYVTLGDPATSGGNLYVEGNADIDGVLSLGDIADVEVAIGDNSSDIMVNASDIDVNESDIMVNASDIDVNESDIMVNASDIDVNESDIMVNASDIDVNESDIMVNASDIDVNESDIVINEGDIDANTAAIVSNDSDIAANVTAIDNNTTAIGNNTTAIGANSTAIGNNTTAIGANTTAIGENSTAIDANATAIGDNSVAIGENADDIDDLNELIFVDPHGNTHISGPNSDSLYTRFDEEDGNQKLGAIQDMEGEDHPNLVDIDVVTNLNVSGMSTDDGPGVFTVQKNDTPPTTDSDEILDPVAPFFDEDGVVTGTVAVYTEKTDATVTSETTDNSGFKADTDGNVWLFASGGSTDTIDYVTYVRQDIYDENQGALAGTKQGDAEVGGYFDADGNFVELGVLMDDDGVVDGIGVLDQSVFTEQVLADMAAAGAYTSVAADGNGGNLYVEGDTTVMGNLLIGESGVNVEETLDTHFGLVSQNIADIADNASTLVVHEGLVTQNIADIATNSSDIADNSSTLDVHFGLVSQNIADIETNANAIDDAVDRLDYHEGLVLANISEIASINSTLDTHFSLVSQNIQDIEKNTRGIAMTAALTHTTILPGMENALDISMAYFEGETGVSISYSRRINEGTQINFAAASTTDFEETVVRGGVGWQW